MPMAELSEASSGDRNFHHPYTPYPIQQEFMTAVYDCLEHGQIGILESPTGTGKSLSLICGSMTWLREHERKAWEAGHDTAASDDDEPAWMLQHAREQQKKAAQRRRADMRARLARARANEERAAKSFGAGEPASKRQKMEDSHETAAKEPEAQFLLDDYESDTEQARSAGTSRNPDHGGLSAATQALMDKYSGTILKKSGDHTDDDDELKTKILFCSRTHSQLSQFVAELRRVHMPSGVPPEAEERQNSESPNLGLELEQATEDIKHLTLGSRKNLCIHPHVSKLRSVTAMNERCLELKQSSTPKDKRCKFLPTKDNEPLLNDFRDAALSKLRDIEDLAGLGKRIGICPYYASRTATKLSEIVSLPYPLLLQKSAREALELSLKNHVVIIDEAHNLMDAICNIHSVSVSLDQLKTCRGQIGVYLQKFRNRLKGKNRVYVTQLVRLLDSLAGYLERQSLRSSTSSEEVISVGDLMTGKGADQINLYKLMHYLKESKLARKVDGYSDYTIQQQPKQGLDSALSTEKKKGLSEKSMPVLSHVESFLLALTYPASEGRFFYSQSRGVETGTKEEIVLKYLLLDPSHHFKEIVEEARAVILAGGTMSPMDEYVNQLFPYTASDRIKMFSYGHVIPPSNLITIPVTTSPNGTRFDFTFEKRSSEALISELGQALIAIARVVPDGMVVFFPSYSYLATVTAQWSRADPQSPSSPPIMEQLARNKRIFQESTTKAPSSTSTPDSDDPTRSRAPPSTTETLLASYTAHIHSSTTFSSSNKSPSSATTPAPAAPSGALLFAVINGSLSEGINFSDRLGRCVVLIGLPFPNARSPAWAAKLDFLRARNPATAQSHALNTAMRAANQAVGRAIRHKADYAAVVLLDGRFARADVRGRLAGWVRERIVAEPGEGVLMHRAVSLLEGFFAEHG